MGRKKNWGGMEMVRGIRDASGDGYLPKEMLRSVVK
jgi:hypothetical protein